MNAASLPQPGYLPQGRRFLTFKQAAREFPAWSVSSLRWLRVNGDTNGFNQCVIEVGCRKVLIDAIAFEQWLEGQRASHKEAS